MISDGLKQLIDKQSGRAAEGGGTSAAWDRRGEDCRTEERGSWMQCRSLLLRHVASCTSSGVSVCLNETVSTDRGDENIFNFSTR